MQRHRLRGDEPPRSAAAAGAASGGRACGLSPLHAWTCPSLNLPKTDGRAECALAARRSHARPAPSESRHGIPVGQSGKTRRPAGARSAQAPAMILLARLSGPGQIDRRAIASLAGLAPRASESGRWQGRRALAKGAPRAQPALHASMAALRTGFLAGFTKDEGRGEAGNGHPHGGRTAPPDHCERNPAQRSALSPRPPRARLIKRLQAQLPARGSASPRVGSASATVEGSAVYRAMLRG